MADFRNVSPRFASLALLGGFALAVSLSAFAQPPEVEDSAPKKPAKKIVTEDEDPKGTIKKKVIVDDPDTRPATAPPSTAPDEKLEELEQAVREATLPLTQSLLTKYAVPFDTIAGKKGVVLRVKPIPLYRSDKFPPQFGIFELDANNHPKEIQNVSRSEVRRFDYFEERVLADTDHLLKLKPLGTMAGPQQLTAEEQLETAEKLLAAALRFHDYARNNPFPGREMPIRSGKSWDTVRRPLDDRLRGVRLQLLKGATAASDWPKARLLGTKLMTAYPKDAAVSQEVAAARVAEAEPLVKSRKFADLVKARKMLDEFDAVFPGGGGEPAHRLRKELTDEASRLFGQAKAYKSAGNASDARNELERAEAIDPALPGLREMKKELGSGYAVLYVGVRQVPERMSPATARFDSEKQAVELLFEGLLQEVPDGTNGVRYRPGAAIRFPTVVNGGRDVRIRQIPRSGNGPEGFDAHDVVETVRLLRSRPDLWPAAGLPWLDDLPAPTGGGSLRLSFRHGHPDPRSLLTFKLLPGRWFAERGKTVDDREFAERPFGTGPFRIHALSHPNATGPREVIFVDNAAYGRGRDRGPPRVREIRFVEAARLTDPLADFRAGRLHLLPDLTPDELARALSQGGTELGGKGQVVVPAANRRVHILALNHRRMPFQNRDLRRGIALAIDREAILNDVFRSAPVQYRRFTAAMTGPFPPTSWATFKTPTGQPIPLLNRDEALIRLNRYLASPGAATALKLAYPTGDPQAATVCERIKGQVESLFPDASGGRKLAIELLPLEPRKLLLHVEGERRYDLAYVPFDYPDDWYPYGLAAFLDPTAAGRDGRNITGYLSPDANPDEKDLELKSELAGLTVHADYARIARSALTIHKLFNDTMPFVPLWQTDRYLLANSSLKVFVEDSREPAPVQILDPTVLFSNVSRWYIE